jgi:subtilisin-like proprotein convertase family protein
MHSHDIARWGVKAALIAAMIVSSSAASTVQFSKEFNLPIPSPKDPDSEYERGWMEDAVVEVESSLAVYDLDVHVCLTHSNFFDLQLLLQSPSGTVVMVNNWGNLALLNDGGRKSLIFDDEALLSIDKAVKPAEGPYRPVEPLSRFDGQNLAGRWTLRIYDGIYDDSGTLHSVQLVFTVPEPATMGFFGAGLILLLRKRTGAVFGVSGKVRQERSFSR